MYEIETATNENQNHDDSGSTHIFQTPPLIYRFVNYPLKVLINSHIHVCSITKPFTTSQLTNKAIQYAWF